MEPKIMDKAAAKIAGFSLHTTSVDGQNNREIPAFWQAFMSDGRIAAGHPDFESYDERSQKSTGQQCDIYIPIMKKG